VIQQGGRGGTSSLLLRGGEPNFTVVLIDGVQVNDPSNTRGGSYDIGNLEQSQLENVELSFGPLSPVHGSDALSGVVNFETRGADSGSDIAVEAGTQSYQSANAFYGGNLGSVDVGVGAYVTNDNGDVDGADFESKGVNGRFGVDFAGAGTLGLSLGYLSVDSTSFPEDSGGPELAVIRELDTRDIDEGRAGLDIAYVFADRWRTRLFASYYSHDEDFTSPGIAPGVLGPVPANSADTDFDRTQVLASVATDISDNITMLVGAEWQNEDGTSKGIIDFGGPVPTDFALDRDTVSAFAEASVELGELILQGAIRWDDPDEIDSETTGRLGALYKLNDGRTQLRVNWGEGFKAPSFFALGHPLVGNPDLKSETGKSYDASITQQFPAVGGLVELGVFRNEYEDLVDFDDELFLNVNRDKVVTKGGELAGQVSPVPELTLRAHVTYLDTDIRGSDDTLRGRPEWRGGLVVDWRFIPNWRWVTSVLTMDKFYESSVPTGEVKLDGYTRVDTALNWQVSDSLSVSAAVDNVLDKDYEEAVGFPAAGVRGRVGAKYSF
jgi:iron complex outermembrane receptor protein/vitamin B12 transporter